MNIGRLIIREILFRKLSFALGVLSVLAAVGCLVGALTSLRQHDRRTEQIIAAKQAETQEKMELLTDDYRRITLKLGFNVLILPKDQKLSDLYAEDYASKYMPEEYATRLAKSRVATINHVLPSLQQKVKWPETGRTILLMGVRGEVYLHSARQKPLLQPVQAGTIVLGSELHQSLKLKTGDKTRLMGREFTVAKLNEERGTKDDITAWINLAEAQAMLGKEGLINGILALDCTCADSRLPLIRAEIEKILPDTQVIEFASQAIARAESRRRASAEAEAAIEREKQGRARLRSERESFAAVLVPLVVIGCAVWIGFLALANVRERRGEIGVLRALGVRARQILWLFLGRAVAMGVAGAGLGYVAGQAGVAGMEFDAPLRVAGLAGAPLLATLGGWGSALLASPRGPGSLRGRGGASRCESARASLGQGRDRAAAARPRC